MYLWLPWCHCFDGQLRLAPLRFWPLLPYPLDLDLSCDNNMLAITAGFILGLLSPILFGRL
jgi:hypothetical protein